MGSHGATAARRPVGSTGVDERFTTDGAVMLLMDHQTSVMEWVVQYPPRQLVAGNVAKLAQAASVLGVPLILTTNQEDVNGALIPELAGSSGDAAARRIQRAGTVDALADPRVAKALEATGRRQLLLAGIGSDVCAVFPTLHALRAGYDVQVLADACGTSSALSHEVALRRMEQAGAKLATTASVLAELAGDFSTPEGAQILGIMLGRVSGASASSGDDAGSLNR